VDVEILDATDGQLRVMVRGVDPTFMNAMRRIVMSEIPVPSIELVYIIENTGVLYDEIIAHRMGYIPLKGGEALIFTKDCECQGKGCPRCEAILAMDVTASENNFKVLSGRLKAEGSVFAANTEIPIAELNAGQRLALEARARLGTAKQHAKWQPVSIAVVKYEPQVKIDQKTCDLCALCVDECPKKILEIKEKRLVVTSPLACSLCKVCESICQKGSIKVTYNDSNAVLTIESTGGMTNEELVSAATDVLLKKCSSLRDALKELPEAA